MILYNTRALLQWDLGCGAHFNLHLADWSDVSGIIAVQGSERAERRHLFLEFLFLKCLSFFLCLLAYTFEGRKGGNIMEYWISGSGILDAQVLS